MIKIKTSVSAKIAKDRWRITDTTIDRTNESMSPKGARLENYKKNPLILFEHGFDKRGNMPIGVTDIESIEITDNYIDVTPIWDKNGLDIEAKMIAEKAENGFLRSASIGFKQMKAETDETKEGKPLIITDWELLEWSVVSFPANPNAHSISKMLASYKGTLPENLNGFSDSEIELIIKLANMPEIQWQKGIARYKEIKNIETNNKLENVTELSNNVAKQLNEVILSNISYYNDSKPKRGDL